MALGPRLGVRWSRTVRCLGLLEALTELLAIALTVMSFSKYQLSDATPRPDGVGPPLPSAHLKASLQSTQQHSLKRATCSALNLEAYIF